MKLNMIKNIKRYIILGTIGILCFTSCYKDLGTYTASEINEVAVTFPSPKYEVFTGDTLKINPVYSYTMDKSPDTSRYTYKWYFYKRDIAWYDPSYTKELSFEKNLNYKINLSFGVYDLNILVTDKVTKAEFRASTVFEVKSNNMTGWMMLSDIGNNSRLDMVRFKNGVADSTILDVLAFQHSALKLSGNPIDLWKNDEYNSLCVSTTGNGTTYIDPVSLDWQPSGLLKYHISGTVVPDNYYAEEMMYRGYYKNGNVYSDIVGGFNFPINRVKTESKDFVASKFVGFSDYWYGGTYLYDMTNKRFVLVRGAQPNAITLPDGTLFPFNNTGKDLVFMVFSKFNAGEMFFIWKDPATSKFFLGRFQRAGEEQRYYQDITNAPGISLAENFAVSSNWGYVFYSVGGKLYEYDLGLKSTKLMLDYSPNVINKLEAGENVFNSAATLIIASYDPKSTAKSGTLDSFEVPGLNAALIKKESYTGFGKIVDFFRKN